MILPNTYVAFWEIVSYNVNWSIETCKHIIIVEKV